MPAVPMHAFVPVRMDREGGRWKRQLPDLETEIGRYRMSEPLRERQAEIAAMMRRAAATGPMSSRSSLVRGTSRSSAASSTQLAWVGSLTTDAHLAAISIEHGFELHSNDADFGRFAGLLWKNPLALLPGPGSC